MAATVTEIARANGGGGVATITATVGDITPLTSGHVVVVAAFNDNETIDAGDISDTDGLTWQHDHQRIQGTNVCVCVFSAEITSGSVDDGHQFTVSNNGVNATQREIIVYHVDGLASTTWLDEIGDNGANNQTVLSATLDASTTEDATLVFGAGCIISDAALGWTPDGTDGDVVDGTSNRSLVTSWHSETTAGTHSEGGTADASGNYAFVVVAYIEDAGAAGDTLTAGGAVAAGNGLSAVAPGATAGAVAQGNTLLPAATATAGGALARGNTANEVSAALTQGGAAAAGTSPSAAATLTAGGAIAGGNVFDTEEGDTLTPGGALAAGNTLTASAGATVGGGLAQGNTIAAAVPVTGGSANAQGNEPTPALALLTVGGAIAAGNTFAVEEGDTLTPGGAVAQGNTMSAAAAAAVGGALAQGNIIAAAVPITGGSANAQGNQPSPAVALLTIGGAIAGGNTIGEIGAVFKACVTVTHYASATATMTLSTAANADLTAAPVAVVELDTVECS